MCYKNSTDIDTLTHAQSAVGFLQHLSHALQLNTTINVQGGA